MLFRYDGYIFADFEYLPLDERGSLVMYREAAMVKQLLTGR